MGTIIVVVLFILSLLLSAMIAAYGTLSTSHLRHWARQHDEAASKLYPLKARGSASLLTLELFRAIAVAAMAAILAVRLSPLLVGLILASMLFGAFVLLVQMYLKPIGMQLLVWLGAPLLFITHILKLLTLPLGRALDSFLADEPSTLTRSDLSKTLKKIVVDDTDLTKQELRMLKQVLEFNHGTVHDFMVPKKSLSLVDINESLTPVVLDELHRNGQDYFPVSDKANGVVGLLSKQDITDINRRPVVVETMKKAEFIDENKSLINAAEQFYTSKQPALIVNDEEGNIAGLLTADTVLKALIGEQEEEEIEDVTVTEPENPEQIAE